MKDRCEKSREIDIPREESPPIIEESLLDKYISERKEKKNARPTTRLFSRDLAVLPPTVSSKSDRERRKKESGEKRGVYRPSD